ncbi:AAA family ATPase [Magnetospirillum sp. 64-120]|uniref:Lon protease family protein n=1 Tax=Magnetospirillum sp. 64-120 TaxID=1895778 RepID=UPI000926B883|nr:AAA family ATPase [Magnetospirillum sp. 64-120]OJX79645.1 MAG: ATP-dependent protease [Magnetospirillum sp. 64-120]
MSPLPQPLPPERLYKVCDPASLPFDSTAELADSDNAFGQDRAVEAIGFAMAMRHRGFNLFALGPEGTGRRSLVMRLLAAQAAKRPVPDDWAYVNDFEQNQRPKALRLPAGRANGLKKDMDWLVGELGQALPAAFEAEEYRNRRQAIEDELKERQEEAFRAIAGEAGEKGVALVRTPVGLALAPMVDGEVLSPEQFKQLPEDTQTRFKADMEGLQEKLEGTLKEVPKWERESRARLRELDHDVVAFAIEHLLDEITAKYPELDQVQTYLQAVAADVAANVGDFLGDDDRSKIRRAMGGDVFRRYRVNVLVDNGATQGAPVVYEDYPTQPNLIGRVEHLAQMGALITDFNLVRAGALHKANGGFLVMDARKLLMNPFAWEDLKRALKAREVRIESPGQSMGLLSTFSLEPQPIALDIKVVLIGEPMLYYLLSHHDPEFAELFKVAADFDWRMDRSDPAILALAGSVATLCRKEGLLPLDRTGMARVVEQASRQVEDADKLSTHMASLADLVREADYWAGRAGAAVIDATHVQQAVESAIRRQDRVRENVQHEIERGIIHIATEGAEVGQINGLAVLQLGNFAFGHPSRITARIHAGKGDVIDIEREVELGGPLHGKGVLILNGFLAARFGAHEPLSLSASLVFEQSYGGVDGDSASSTELYVLLSALSGLPIRQDLAVTGSVDQFGRVQAIGGVNEKIEGFFDLCAARGLTGTQGVMIPATNVGHLMLRHDVVEACRQGRFAIYPVDHVDQGIALLTGAEAGEADEQGRYPAGTVNRKVQARLAAFSQRTLRPAEREKPEKERPERERERKIVDD